MINPGLITGGASLVGDTIGMIGQNAREKRAMQNQQKLMGIQTENQMKLNKQGFELQKAMWNETNYEAQMQKMREAGLNSSLMYGMKGGGGVTTGSQGGGSATGGSAPSPQPMDIGNKIQAVAQLALLNAQKKNIEADTYNKLKTGDNQYETSIGKNIENTVERRGIDAKVAEYSNREEKAKAEGKMKYGKWANNDGGKEWEDKLNNEPENREEQMILNEYKNSQINTEFNAESIYDRLRLAKANANNEEERNDILKAERIIKEFEADLAKNGIPPNSPWYAKLLGDLLEKLGILDIIGAGKKEIRSKVNGK